MQLLYEAGFTFEIVYILPFMLLLSCCFFPTLIKKVPTEYVRAPKDKEGNIDMKFVNIFCKSGAFFIVFWISVACIGQFHMYKNTVGAYKKGNYLIVEGYIENFTPMSNGGHKRESFDINGVHFEYSDAEIIQGYNTPRFHGGIIKENGQYLKIGYVYYNSSYGNIIVRIEG